MRRCGAFLGAVLAALVCTGLGAAEYSIVQITNNERSDEGPQINSSGQMVWIGTESGGDSEIFYHDGISVVQLTDNDYDDVLPQINDLGQVVWMGGGLHFYDGQSIIQITDQAISENPARLNDSGRIVWETTSGSGREICLYEDGTITQLTDNDSPDLMPQINDAGHVVWAGCDGSYGGFEIFLYDGSTTTQLTDNSHDDVHPKINDSGHVVWQQYPYDSYPSGDPKLYLWDGEQSILLSAAICYEHMISDGGHVVWTRAEGYPPYEPYVQHVYLYEGALPATELVSGLEENSDAHVNSSGHVVWEGNGGQGIFLYDGAGVTEIWDAYSSLPGVHALYTLPDWGPKINDIGWIVWDDGSGVEREIYLARPVTEPEWAAASVTGMGPQAPSRTLACLLALLVPIGVAFSLRRRHGGGVRRRRGAAGSGSCSGRIFGG